MVLPRDTSSCYDDRLCRIILKHEHAFIKAHKQSSSVQCDLKLSANEKLLAPDLSWFHDNNGPDTVYATHIHLRVNIIYMNVYLQLLPCE